MPLITIQGIECHYRAKREFEEVLYVNLPQDEQYFRRVQHPFSDEDLIDIANRVLVYRKEEKKEEEEEKKGKKETAEEQREYTQEQRDWVDKQEKIFEDGVYAMIDGVETFIPGAYWCYVNFWTLEHGDKPEYREDDRIFFLFHEYLRLETDVLGLTRGKGRRQGATSIGTFFMWFVAGRLPFKNAGLTSYNDAVAQDVFQKMFLYGFKSMLPCFQKDFDSDSENFIRFVKATDRKKKGVLAVKREGLNSYVDYRPNVINSYDSGRQSYNMPDESGKRMKLNINSYWSKLNKTFRVGKEKVGFGYLPTTVNKKSEGGEQYKQFWKDADQFRIDPETKKPVGIKTVNKCVRYFVPATHCFSGCIDKFGRSIIDDPIEPVIGNDGHLIYEGSKSIILKERKLLESGDAEQYMEHRRDYPLDEYDMFAFETGNCEFNEKNLITQIEELEINPVYLRKVRFFEEKRVERFADLPPRTIREIKYMDDEKGGWLMLEEPQKRNHFTHKGDIIRPLNTLHYCIGVDTFRIGFADNGSKGTICVFKKSHIVNGKEEGLYPVALYVGRPRLIQHLYDEVIKACMFYGCKVNFEISAGDFFYGYFFNSDSSKNTFGVDATDLLYWTPAVDPNKENPKFKPGTESASPYELAAQLDAAKVYFDGTDPGGYNGNVHRVKFPSLLRQALDYNHSERTPYDEMISLMMALLPALKSPTHSMPQNLKPKTLLPRYAIQLEQ